MGLIRISHSTDVKVDSRSLPKLLKKEIHKVPRDPESLSYFLHGLGEMSARSHAQTSDFLIEKLSKDFKIRWEKVVSVAFSREEPLDNLSRLDVLGFSQWISSSKLEWNTLAAAKSHIGCGREPILCGHYGITFLSRIALTINARAADTLLKQHPNDTRTAAIGRAALQITTPLEGTPQPEALLRSHRAAVRCLGAAALLTPPDWDSKHQSLEECHNIFLMAGLTASDCIWMMALRLKESIHRHYQLRSVKEDQTVRLNEIKRHPDRAIGGPQNAAQEMTLIKERLDTAVQKQSELKVNIENTIKDISSLWPENGLSEKQIEWLEPCFVDTDEFRYRLAERLPLGNNRDSLLKTNIDTLRTTFGFIPKNNKPSLTSPPILDDKKFVETAPWAVESIILLHQKDPTKIGRVTGQLLNPIHKIITEKLQHPFIRYRQPSLWENMLSSIIYAYRFAFVVVGVSREKYDIELSSLNEHAIKNTYSLLSTIEAKYQKQWLLNRLILDCLHSTYSLSNTEEVLQTWALSDNLHYFARALALWSSPQLIDQHYELSVWLFEITSEPPMSRESCNESFNTILNLIDTAFASAAASNRPDIIDDLVSRWKHAYQNWPFTFTEGDQIILKLANAVKTNGEDRKWLLAEPEFQYSACRRFLSNNRLLPS